MFRNAFILCILLYSCWVKSQHPNWKVITLYRPYPDSLKLDTATIPEDKWFAMSGTTVLNKENFKFNVNTGFLYFDTTILNRFDSISILWSPIHVNLSKIYYHKDTSIITKTSKLLLIPYNEINYKKPNFFETGSIEKSGNFTRGISIGNRQDPGFNSSLNLSLRGKITEDLEISAHLTDQKLPIQPQGTTQQIQDIDNIFIQLKYRKFLLDAGDIELSSDKHYFLKYRRKVEGIKFQDKVRSIFTKNDSLFYHCGTSFSRGQYARISINPIEGNQGPYRLYGKNNEMYIIILAGTERVYLDGELLQRGQENDYVINYNTAEITFTHRIQIRSNSRIIVEFQYIDRFYNKYLLTTGVQYHLRQWKIRASMMEEKDLKSQPIEPLSDSARKVLFITGDSLQHAYLTGIRVVPFQNDLVLYAMKDSLGYDSVFYYSTNPDSARYLLYFSYVGQHKGNYILDPQLANGKVYRWICPVNGIPQGSYEPVIQLVTPQKTSMWTIATDFQPNSKTLFNLEYARSTKDLNTFSPYHDNNNHGNAIKFFTEYKRPLRHLRDSSSIWKIFFSAEATDSLFSPVEKFLPLEFERNWSLHQSVKAYQLLEMDNLIQVKQFSIRVQNSLLHLPSNLLSTKTSYLWQVKINRFYLFQSGSYVSPWQGKQLPFFQYKNVVSFLPWKVKLNLVHTGEIRKGNTQLAIDTNQFRWNQVMVYVQNIDTNQWTVRPYYSMRLDERFYNGHPIKTRHSHETGLNFTFHRFLPIQWQSDISYWWFPVLTDTSMKTHFLQMKHTTSQQYFKGFLSFSLRYLNRMGRENKKEFFFLEVAPGQGSHTWKDYNHNGIKELNEFVLASFQDQANYIKMLLPSTQYQIVYDIYSSGDMIIDAAKLNIKRKFWIWLQGLKNTFSFQFNSKNTSPILKHHFIPHRIPDSLHLFLSQSLREQISFRNSTGKISTYYLLQVNKVAQSYFYGTDDHTTIEHRSQTTFQFKQHFYFEPLLYQKSQKNLSVVSYVQSYQIDKKGIGLILSYQRSIKWRTSVGSSFEKSQNMTDTTKTLKQTWSIEHRHSFATRGNISLKFQFQNIYGLNKAIHPYIEYIMLEGYKVGKNFSWEIMFMRRLDNNIELTFMYTGRALPHETVVHTGSAQIRVIF
ncbi:MAG: hypothetical protein N2Z72_02435 [Bacteroidales bacterium]|nr:hypothetical protein [Bacteroidales bacterium]